LLRVPKVMEQVGQLACNGYDRLVPRLLAAACCQMQSPLSQCRVSLRIAFTGLAAFRSETKIATDVSTASESTLIPERQDKRKGGDVADPMDRNHGLCLNILGLSQPLNVFVILLDLESHLRDLSENRTERQLQSWRHRCVPSLREALRGRGRHTMAACLRQSTNRVDGRGSQTDKKLASANQGEGLLLLDGAMRNRAENLRSRRA